MAPGTRCEYCFRRDAYAYIPDPYCAPLCEVCEDLDAENPGVIGIHRIDTLGAMWAATKARNGSNALPAVFGVASTSLRIYGFLWDDAIIPGGFFFSLAQFHAESGV